jgi:hypothetical protein
MARTTGYWAYVNDDGTGERATKTHVAEDSNPIKPICGSRIHKRMKYQWCAQGVYEDYVECRKCLEIIIRERHKRAWERQAIKETRKIIEEGYRGTVQSRKCECCGHHEVGVNAKGKFIPIRPGDKIVLHKQEER